MLCAKCGNQTDELAKYCQVCGTALNTPTVNPPAAAAVNYARFWERFLAIIIDTIIVAAASGIAFVGTFGHALPAGFLAPWLYEAFMMSSEWQATVGKRVMSIVVTDLQGSRISFARATGRHFAKYLSAFLLGIGFVMAAFTSKKQALHDIIAETTVLKR
jgi:uncharacterized RDD family membrane protein YckC